MENIYNILQWSASSHPEHAQGYLEQHLQACDVCVIERGTQHHLDTITQHFPHVHKKKQFENRYLITATHQQPHTAEFISLPSKEYGQQPSQTGSGALLTVLDHFTVLNFATVWDNIELQIKDIEFMLDDVLRSHNRWLMVGDLHVEPVLPKSINDLLSQHDCTYDWTRDLITFSQKRHNKSPQFKDMPPQQYAVSHDRVITHDLTAWDFQSHHKPFQGTQSHWIFEYKIK